MNKLCCEFLGNPQIFVCEKNTQKMLLPNCECACVRMCVCMCVYVFKCICVGVCVCVCVYVPPDFWRRERGNLPFSEF